MTRLYIISVALIAILIASCNGKYKFWELSKFKIDSTALLDNEEIKLLYTSRGPDDSKPDFYYHIVVVSLKTGDTVNILTTGNQVFQEGDGDSTFFFFDLNNEISKLLELDIEQYKEVKNINNLPEAKSKKRNKVARDPEFDYIADNKFPAVIGYVGRSYKKNLDAEKE